MTDGASLDKVAEFLLTLLQMRKFTLLQNRLPITPLRRDLIHQVAEDLPDLMPFCFKITFVPQCDEVLNWLIRNRLTGHSLEQWLDVKFGGRAHFLRAVFFVLTRLGYINESTATLVHHRARPD